MEQVLNKKLKKLLTIRKRLEKYQNKLHEADTKKKHVIEAKMVELVNKSIDVIYSVE